MEKKIQYVENNQTKLLSKICKEAGYSKCLCHIWKDHLYFNDPATPENYGIWFSYGENGWQKTCRTMDPWYDKIYKGLRKCFPNGIEGLEIYDSKRILGKNI